MTTTRRTTRSVRFRVRGRNRVTGWRVESCGDARIAGCPYRRRQVRCDLHGAWKRPSLSLTVSGALEGPATVLLAAIGCKPQLGVLLSCYYRIVADRASDSSERLGRDENYRWLHLLPLHSLGLAVALRSISRMSRRAFCCQLDLTAAALWYDVLLAWNVTRPRYPSRMARRC